MTLNNSRKRTLNQSTLTMPADDNILNLPDLSAFQDAEKQHILDVLLRDENLRQKHLARFLNLRKEVADLEQQSQSTSTSACARCQTPFGYIFNTGDACPKCSAKVCKQCRLMYNVNDNGWLCQLCCKQMQLMSYSGEWIYSLHTNLRKQSAASSDVHNRSLPPSTSFQNLHAASSSDSESEVIAPTQSQKVDRFSNKPLPSKLTKLKLTSPIDKMIVQNLNDVQKLNFVKQRMEHRPPNVSFTQPLPRRTRRTLAPSDAIKNSSDEIDSFMDQANDSQDRLVNKQNSPLSNNVNALKTNEKHIDVTSTIPPEKVTDKRSIKNILKIKQHSQPSPRDSKLSLASIATTNTSSGRHLSASVQSLRDAVHRIPHPHFSSSRISLNSDKNRQVNLSMSSTMHDEDAASLKLPSVSSRTTFVRVVLLGMHGFENPVQANSYGLQQSQTSKPQSSTDTSQGNSIDHSQNSLNC